MLRPRKQTLDSDSQVDDEREALLDGNINRDLQASYQSDNYNYYPSRGVPSDSLNQQPSGRHDLRHSDPFQPIVPTPIQRKARDKSPEQHRARTNPSYLGNTSYASLTGDHITQSAFQPTTTHHRNLPDSYELVNTSSTFSRTINLNQGGESYSRHQDFIYYTVQPGDTLHNLSVRYSCPVASIKRLNNLWSDQEFYGLSRIKLPAGKLRLIADAISEEATKPHIPYHTSQADINSSGHQGLIQQAIPQTQLSQSLQSPSIHDRFNGNDLDAAPLELEPGLLGAFTSDSIFKDLDLNIEKARTAARSYDENASAIMQTLAEGGNIVGNDDDDMTDVQKAARKEAENLLIDMSDIGLSYNGLVLFIFIVCLIFPLAYVIYLEETHHDSSKPIT